MAKHGVNLPKGFVLDQPQSSSNLPEGFVLDAPEQPGGAINTLGFVNKAIAQTLGAPVDISRSILNLIPGLEIPKESIGGSESIKRGFEKLGIATARREPEKLSEYVGTGVGEVTGLLLPFTKALQHASKGKGMVSKISKTIMDSIQSHPFITGVSEVTAGGGAGTGRFLKEEVLPEGSVAGALAEPVGGIAGGLAPSLTALTPTAIIAKTGKGVLRKASLPFSEKGSEFRAGEFLKKQVQFPQEVAGKVTEKTIGDLPPAVASGEKRLISLYNKFRTANPVSEADSIKKLSHSIIQLEKEMRSFGYSAPEILQEVTKRRVASIEFNMQKRVADAMDVAQKKLNALPVARRQSQESVIVRDELLKVKASENVKVQDAWRNVPKDIVVDYSKSKQTLKTIIDDLPKAQKGDIPEVLIGKPEKGGFLASQKPPKFPVTVNEMQGLRSKLLEVERIAKKNGQWNTARIAGDVSDAILDDLSESGADESLKIAIAATRQFKERFERGIVGKALGFAKTGAPSISPELTLDISIGRSNIRGATDINKITVTPEATAATKRYLGRSFTDYVTNKGTKPFNVDKAGRWIENNREILDQFPEMRNQLNDISGAHKLANDTLAVTNQRLKTLRDPRISTAAKFLNAEPGKEIETIFRSKDSARLTNQLVRQARKDPTGEAIEGLKGAYVDHVIQKSSIGPYNEIGEQTLSGNTLLGFINKNRSTLSQVFNKNELSRMERIGRELSKLEMVEKGTGNVQVEMEDIASNLMMMINRIGGAQLGRWIARMTGGGTVQTPAIISERMKVFARHLNQDRAFQLMHDAITADDGGKLLNALLLPIDKPTTSIGLKNLRILNQQMNLWLIGSGSRVLEDIKKDVSIMDEDEPLSPERRSFFAQLQDAETRQLQEQSHRNPQMSPRLSNALRRPPQVIP